MTIRSFNNKILFRISVCANIVIITYMILSVILTKNCDPSKPHFYIQLQNPSEIEKQSLPNTGNSRYTQRGDFWILENYISAAKSFSYNESITFASHGDFTYLDNLVPLLERWNGPISMSVYTPGKDFEEALFRIIYLRECSRGAPLVKKFASFHFYFEGKHFPKMEIPKNPSSLTLNCSRTTPPVYNSDLKTYKQLHKLTYPINIGRNVAREMSSTDYVLSADIELYPSPNLISSFLEMLIINSFSDPQIFVLPIFEVENYVTGLPENKQELVFMLKNGSAVTFHKYVCDYCHKIPNYAEWIAAPIKDHLDVFHTAKRQGNYIHWEPIFIARNNVPFYDERLNREGLKDKMTQGYILCVLDYDFHILNNAFLIHRPGVKRKANENPEAKPYIDRQNKVIEQSILPEINILFGQSNNCDA